MWEKMLHSTYAKVMNFFYSNLHAIIQIFQSKEFYHCKSENHSRDNDLTKINI